MPDTMTHFDLLLTGLTVITVDASMSVLRDASIGIADGRIAWMFPSKSLIAADVGGALQRYRLLETTRESLPASFHL